MPACPFPFTPPFALISMTTLSVSVQPCLLISDLGINIKAGGHNVNFNEMLTFDKPLMENLLSVKVFDQVCKGEYPRDNIDVLLRAFLQGWVDNGVNVHVCNRTHNFDFKFIARTH